MIYFRNLESEGAFSFGKINLELANQGLTLITGRNLDDFEGSTSGSAASGSSANGAGKSSLLEILTHNIFASTGKGVRKNQVVNTEYSKGYMSRLTLDLAGDQYQYLQTRNHTPLGTINQIYKMTDGKYKDLEIKGLEETQKTFQQKVKLSLDDWYATVYASQQSKHLFTRTDSNDLKKDMLARIFNLNYKMYLEDTKKRLEATRTALVALKSSIASTKTQIQAQIAALPYHTEIDFQTRIAELTAIHEGIKAQITTKTNLLSAFQQAKINRATKSNYEIQIQEQLTQCGAWTGAIPTSIDLQSTIDGAKAQLQQISTSIQEISSYLQVLQQRDAAFQDLENWKGTAEFESLPKLPELEGALQQCQTSLSNLKTTYSDAFFTNLDNLKTYDFTKLKEMKAEIDLRSEEYKTAAANHRDAEIHFKTAKENWVKIQSGTCYACDRPFPPEKMDSAKAEYDRREAEEKSTNLLSTDLKRKLDQLVGDYGVLQQKFNEYENYRSRLLDPTHLSWTLADYQAQKAQLESSYTTQKAFLDSVRLCKVVADKWQTYSTVVGEYITYEKSLEDLNHSSRNFTNYLMALASILSLVQQYETIEIIEVEEIDEMQVGAEIRRLNDDRDTSGNELSILNRDYEYFLDLSKQMEKILLNEKEIDALEKNEQIYNSLTYVFGPKGLVVSRLEVICRYLTEKVNYYISKVLKENVQLQFVMDDDSLDLNITWNGKERGVANLSGGENGKVGLACMLGLRSLLPTDYQTNILILDEAEANWDDRVRHELVEMLESLLVSTNLDSIFMISHSTMIQELQTWNTHIHCVKEKGISTLEITSR
jgi:DNA repair exonuclease SbcCD ATPase subunit